MTILKTETSLCNKKSYAGCKSRSAGNTKKRKGDFELILIGALLIFGNIIAIAQSTDLSFGFFGLFLLGICAVSLGGIVFGKIAVFFKKLCMEFARMASVSKCHHHKKSVVVKANALYNHAI